MCGVFAYAGVRPAATAAIMNGLRALEYRGYDSWGIAVTGDDGLAIDRRVGRIGADAQTHLGPACVGLGHTRWATHGAVTQDNAHPHMDCRKRLAVVHNGIVENHRELRGELRARGHRFASQTDTEVIAHLIEDEMTSFAGGTLVQAVRRASVRLVGSNAVVVLDALTHELIALRCGSPLLLGLAGDTILIASDAAALLPHTRDAVFLRDGELVAIRAGTVHVQDAETGRAVPVRAERLAWTAEAAQRGLFPHFMLKEIVEQPAQWRGWRCALPEILRLRNAVAAARQVVFLGCGTAQHAALTGSHLLATLGGRSSRVAPASELDAALPDLQPDTLCLALSQSGETADVLDAVKLARLRGAAIAALVNVPGSTLSRLVDLTVPLHTGPEACVLATKSYTAKLAVLLLLSASLGGRVEEAERDLCSAADSAERLFGDALRARSRELAKELAQRDHVYTLGRGASYPVALEAALKIKEGSYVHAEGFAGGELKHGVIALIERGTPCLFLAPADGARSATLSGAAEVSARGGLVVGLAPEPDPVFDRWLLVEDAGLATPLVQAVACQLLAYDIALTRGVDPDRPRNLAKSVTVK